MEIVNTVISKVNKEEINEIMDLQLRNNANILSKYSISTDLNNSNSIYFVAKIDNTIVGYIAANLLYDHIDILSILVDNQYLRNGVASTLLTSILNYAKNVNISDILLEVREANIIAQKLYEKFGFERISIRKKYYPDNLEDALIYKLSI
jgi:ribosomal-protein-alanine N-acetyltransferase